MRRCRPGAAPRPAPGNLVLLADARLVLEPDLYRLAWGRTPGDFVQAGEEVFLNSVTASPSWAWLRGRADNLRKPRARSSRLSGASAKLLRHLARRRPRSGARCDGAACGPRRRDACARSSTRWHAGRLLRSRAKPRSGAL